MEANLLLAFLSGAAATIGITILAAVITPGGRRLDFPRLLGLYFASPGAPGKVYGIGAVLHTLLGGVWGALYVYLMIAMGVDPTWTYGALYGIIHGLFAGAILGTLADSHPKIGPESPLRDPGMYGHRWSKLIPIWLFVLHITYGAIAMGLYNILFMPEDIPTM